MYDFHDHMHPSRPLGSLRCVGCGLMQGGGDKEGDPHFGCPESGRFYPEADYDAYHVADRGQHQGRKARRNR